MTGGGYSGDWAADEMDGAGELRMADGRVATGIWEAGEVVGIAIMRLPTGGRYEGGLAKLPDGNLVPSGHGEAVAAPPNAVGALLQDAEFGHQLPPSFASGGGSPVFRRGGFATALPGGVVRYIGIWALGLPEGHGVATYEDGGVYTGALCNGLRHGDGLMRYADGAEHDARVQNCSTHLVHRVWGTIAVKDDDPRGLHPPIVFRGIEIGRKPLSG